MSKKDDDLTKDKKLPFNALKKGVVGALFGVTFLVGSAGLLTGCTDGQDGKNGSTWYSGIENPTTSAVSGVVGDFYFDEDDFDIYKYTTNGWTLIGNIKGADGANGNNGTNGINGTAGVDGDSVVFRKTSSAIEWKYSKEPDSAYRNLVNLSQITGSNGQNGDNIVLRVDNGQIQWKYSLAEDSTYQNLVSLTTLTGAKGADGKKVIITADAEYIKWRYEDESTYTNLVALSTLKGSEGKSAYQVAKEAGFDGEIDEWLESLKGEDGDSIVLRVENNAIEWKYSLADDSTFAQLISLDELKGSKGDNGDKVVLRVENGHIQWKYSLADDETYENLINIESLTGSDAKQIKITADSEYIKWYYEGEENYTNIIDIASLKGAQGLSAFEIAVKAGFEGDETEWLASLKGVSIVDVDIEYDIDNDGIEYTIYTIYFSNNTSEIIKVEMPKRVEDINLSGSDTYFVCEEGQEPTLKLHVNYQNGTYDYVDVKQDMFVVDENYTAVDFTEIGEYNVKIKYQGKTTETTIYVVDPNDTTVVSCYLNYNNVALYHDGTSLVTNDFLGLEMTLMHANKTQTTLSLNDENIEVNLNNFNSVGQIFEASATYNENNTVYFNVLPLSDLSGANQAFYEGEYNIVCKINEDPFDENSFIRYYFFKEYEQFVYTVKPTADMLVGFDNTVASADTQYAFDSSKTLNCSVSGQVYITVYNPETAQLQSVYYYGDFEVGTMSEDELALNASYRDDISGQFFLEVPYSDVTVVNGSINFDQIGEYTVNITYNGVPGMVFISIYDPEKCNIRSIEFEEYSITQDLKIDKGATEQQIAQFVESKFANQKATLYYYEDVDNESYKEITITSAHIDTSSLDTSKVGTQSIYLVYTLEGQPVAYRKEIEIEVVVDMSSATLVKSYTIGTDLSAWYSSIETYSNGYAIMTSDMMYETFTTEYTIENGLFKYYDSYLDGYGYFALSASNPEDAENLDTIDFLVPTGSQEDPMMVKETYSVVFNFAGMDMPVTLDVYGDSTYTGNGEYFAVVNVTGFGPYSTVKVNIDSENNTLTSIGRTYNIGNDNVLTEAE